MLTVVDLNNFWSPSGGGVRRYHLERMAFYKNRTDIRLVFLMQDSKNFTEEVSPSLVIEHVKAFKIPGEWDYRFIWNPKVIRKYLQKYLPDIVEVGSPYWLPIAVRWASRGLPKTPHLLGFWHADFPVTYVKRGFSHIHPLFGRLGEALAWAYSRWAFFDYKAIQVSSCEVMARMLDRGLRRLHWIPLGVDVELFHPSKRDEDLVRKLKAGNPERLTIFFPHRLTEEKGVHTLLDAYPILCEKLGVEPALVFASIGPYKEKVLEASRTWKHIQYIGFVNGADEMARWYASTDMGLALSAWETFGLSILEGMASGQVFVGANQGAAKEHIETSGCGHMVPQNRPDLLAEAIIDIVKAGSLEQCSQRARSFAEQYTWGACFHRQLELYHKVIANIEIKI